jgi:coenzyme F420-0:L-glutamate ligase/coenzyme F420-1:gamma-L-glutamate ligase
MNSLTLQSLDNLPDINPGDNLAEIIFKSITKTNTKVLEGTIFVIAQKIVSKSENRYINLDTVTPSNQAIELSKKLDKSANFIELVLRESNSIISSNNNVLIVEHKLGFININAGIDRSNIDQSTNQVLLLPEDPNQSAEDIGNELSILLGIKVHIIISDSMTRAYRYGITGFAIGSSGINCLLDKKGSSDMYGNTLVTTEIAAGDELAAAASILMGQGDQRKPIVLINGYKDNTKVTTNAKALGILKKDDLYGN